MLEIIATLLPPLLKMFIEWKVGKKLSEEEYQAFLRAHRKKTARIAESTDEFKAEIERLKNPPTEPTE